jgi:hypothetical protein
MLTRTLVTLTLFLAVTSGPDPKPSSAGQANRPRHARVVDDLEGCRVPPPSPEPVAPASCTDEGRP